VAAKALCIAPEYKDECLTLYQEISDAMLNGAGRCGKSVEKSEGKWNLQNKLLYYFTLLSPMVEPYRRKIFFLIYHTAFICKAPLSNIVRMI